jgi:CHASE2 domain-containing sensor protein
MNVGRHAVGQHNRQMTKYLILLVGLITNLSCLEKESTLITIVNIEHLDRNGIAKQLSIINKYSPRVIGLNFLLTYDSLDKDIPLSEELSRTKNMIQASKLHNNDPVEIAKWDSLEQYHPKFRFGSHGFSNMTITDDSVIVYELPMRQYYKNETEFAFSYLIAMQYNSDKVDSKYKSGNNDFLFNKNSFGRYFKIISANDLLIENFNKQDLIDKIILMGDLNDTEALFYLDKKRTKRISGVEFQACLIKEILN